MKVTEVHDSRVAQLEKLGMKGARLFVIEDVLGEDQQMQAILTRDLLQGETEPRWHISVAGEHTVPMWDTLVSVGHQLRPGVCFVIGVPPESWWINIHPNVLHLYETRDLPLENQWRIERQGHRPS